MEYSFVIPCYRSEKTIGPVVEELEKVAASLGIRDYEVILVNDGSPDNVWQTIRALSAADPRVRGVCLMKNFGQHAAIMAGYRHCSGARIVTLDDDGQSPIDELDKLIAKMDEGYDAVFAYFPEMKQAAFRRFGSFVNEKMAQSMANVPKGLKMSSFFLFKKPVVDEMIKYDSPYPYIGGLVFRVTQSAACVPTHQRERMTGRSGYTLRSLFSLWLNGFTAFSVKPLEVGAYIGVLTALLGFVYAVVIIIRKLVYPQVPAGWSSVVSILLILGGLILIMLGLIGEYIGRIYICLNKTPQYVVRETVGLPASDAPASR